MTIVLPILAFGCAACCVWLTVRVINRDWRSSRRYLIVIPFILLPAYPLSFGTACWLVGRGWIDTSNAAAFYRPVLNSEHANSIRECFGMNDLDSLIGHQQMLLASTNGSSHRITKW